MFKRSAQLPQHTKAPTHPLFRFFKIGIVLFILGVVLEVFIVNRLSTYGEKINEIERKKSQLELENSDLKDKLYTKLSLEKISKQASSLGFDSIKKTEYIK